MGKKSLTIYPSEEQYELIVKLLLEEQMKAGKKISVSKFIVDTFLPSPNGNSPPSLPESIPKNVSSSNEDTDSDSNPFDGDFLEGWKDV
jgi:hypothetical protein